MFAPGFAWWELPSGNRKQESCPHLRRGSEWDSTRELGDSDWSSSPGATQHRTQDQQHGILGNLLEKQNFRRPHSPAWLTSQQVSWVIPLHKAVWESTVVERVCGSSLECMQEVVPMGGGKGAQKGQTNVSHVAGWWKMCPKVNDDLSQNPTAV